MMNTTEDHVFWMALAHLPRWRTERINRLILEILDNRNISLSEFFELAPNDWQQDFGLNEKEIEDLKTAKVGLPDYASLIEKLLKYEIDLIPSISICK